MYLKPIASAMTATSRRHVSRRRRRVLIERLESRVLLSASLADAVGASALVASGAAPAGVATPAIATATLSVQGNSTAISNGESSPSQSNFTDFGGKIVGSGALLTRSYTITNTGSAELDLSGPITLSSTDFSITTQPSLSVAPNGTTTFVISFAPIAVGLRLATVTIASNDPSSPFVFEIQGTGLNDLTLQGNSTTILPGESSPSPSSFTDFGATSADGTVPLTRSYTITNNTSGQLTFGSPAIAISGADAGDFSVTTQPGSALAANGGASTFVITFTPTASGLRTATVTIATNDSQFPSYTFDIQGTALTTTSLAGGLLYDTTAAGSGAVTQDGELLLMNYSGFLTNGTEFDSNTDSTFGHVNPFEFNLGAGQVIQGWEKGLLGMQAGESRT
ncbi:MAG: choice-of-anchor D domain-containing protein, partial [Tepidisphaeraceae bacterium]